jgi:acetyl esterase/lipase
MFKILLAVFLLSFGWCLAQQEIPLYQSVNPNSQEPKDNKGQKEEAGKEPHDILPTLTVFLPSPARATGSAVIICPGGGYQTLVTKREGTDIAAAFNKMGVAAFVLTYRLPDDQTMLDKSIGPLQDAQQAIKVVRDRYQEWKIDPGKIGIMGFSAGGHLAATAGVQFADPVIDNPSETSLRPDFMILVYPVISMTDSLGHKGSRERLLGPSPSEEQIIFFSNEFQVKTETPPTFITHAGDDSVVPVENSLMFYKALTEKNIPSEMHIYQNGEHGYLEIPSFGEWFGRCENWMRESGWL